MKTVTTFAVLALTLLPSFAFADCMGDPLNQTAASCLPGMIWDAEQETCVESPSS